VPSSPPVAARNGRCWRIATALATLLWPSMLPQLDDVSIMKAWPNDCLPSPTAMIRVLSPHARSVMRPAMTLVSLLRTWSVPTTSQTRTAPVTSALAQ